MSVLSVTALNQFYGGSHTLWDVSLDVPAGSRTCLMGRNGMGKTTLLRSILGLTRAQRGSVAVKGKDVTHAPPHRVARLGIAYVPEGRGIFPNLSVHENLVMTARAGVDGECAWTLERVLGTFPRLAERIDHGGQQLSGGEQQMLSIGRALMTNPRLLILDEATEGLAPLVVAEIWRVIASVRATGISTLIVDRDYRKVLAHTDRAVVMEKGRIVLEGASRHLLEQPNELGRRLGV